MMDHPTASWEPIQDGKAFYRRHQIYSVSGKLPHLDDFIIAGCRNGGPLALMRDSSKLISIGRSSVLSKSQIQVYSPAGEGLLSGNRGRLSDLHGLRMNGWQS